MTTVHRIACPIPFPLKTVNAYYIRDSRPTLIDCGVHTPESLHRLESGIQEAGGALRDIRRVIVTHAHTDHAGLAGWLADRFGTEVCIHRHDYPKFIGGESLPKEAYFQRFRRFLLFCGLSESQAQDAAAAFEERVGRLVTPLNAPRLLSGGEIFSFDDFTLRTVPTPGHSAGSVSLVDDVGGRLFSGDALLENITPNPVAEFDLPEALQPYRSLAHFTESLGWMARQPASRVLPGHGEPFNDLQGRARAILNHFERRRKHVLRLVRQGEAADGRHDGATLRQLAFRMFPGLKDMAVFLGLSEAYAYVQSLASASLVATWEEKGVLRYRLKT